MDGVTETATAANAMPKAPPPFLSKTYDMVDDLVSDDVVSWSTSNNSFILWNVPEFSRDILPKYFKHSNFSSFVRQLNTYGFRKVDPDCFEFANEGFLRGQKHLLRSISRRKFTRMQSHQQPSQAQSASVGLCVEVGKFGLEEEVQRLKRDKNVLMQELVKLRQQQQATDQQLHTVGHRVQVMEQRQQQMMSFLAKAVHSPGFLSQLVHQQNESNRRISGVNKKRRLPNQEEENLVGKHDMASPDGQIIKFQPLINEAAKAMLRQILKMNAASRLESTISNGSGCLIDSVPSSDILDSGSSSNEIPAVTLSEVISTSLQSHMSEDPGFCRNHTTASISKIQSPPGALSSNHKTVPETGMLNSLNDTVLLDITRLQKVVPETTVGVPDTRSKGSESRDMRLMDSVSEFLDDSMACINHPAASIFKSHSTPAAVSSNHRTAVPETGVLNSLNDTVLPDITQLQVVPDSRSKGSESQDMCLMDSVSEFLDGSMAITLDEFSADADMLLDGIPKLPGINDVFWEQFLSAGPLIGDTDEVCVSSTGSISKQELQTEQESAWDKTKRMNHLTEQMGLLASGSKRM